jgi:hypothetical protein
MTTLVNTTDKNNVFPPFLEFNGETSYFGGEPPLPVGVGYAVVLGFGIFFSVMTTSLVYINKYFGKMGEITSEHFKYVVFAVYGGGREINRLCSGGAE